MTPEEHLRILGPELLAEIRCRAAAAPPPTRELIDELRPILAPAMQRVKAKKAQQPAVIRAAA